MFSQKCPDSEIVNLAKNLFKYQNFRGSSAVNKFSHKFHKDNSVKAMLSIARKYINDGKRGNNRVSTAFYDTLDWCKSTHVQPLVPSEMEKAGRGFKGRSLHVKTTSEKVSTPKVNTSSTVVKNYKLALQLDDMIKICPNQSYIDGYVDAFKQMEKQLNQTLNFKKIKVLIED